jgi:hypothetical protein
MTTEEILEKVDQLAVGESLVLPGRGEWEIVLTKREDGLDLTHRNPTKGGCKFFTYDTSGNPYGAGMIVQEPTLGVPCRKCGVDVDGTIVGALVLGEDGKIRERFSWSNLVFMKKGAFSIGADGAFTVNGVTKGYLVAIFLPDKNRLEGYVGVFGSTKPEKVKIIEMENLLLASI